jgi:hypothetical protein
LGTAREVVGWLIYSESRDASLTPSAGAFFNAVLFDGWLLGRWKPTAKRNSVLIETVLSRALRRAEAKVLDAAVKAYGRFVGGPATLAPVRLTAARTHRK